MLSVSPVLIVVTVIVSVMSEMSVRSIVDVQRGGGVRRALEGDRGGVLEGGRPHGAAGGSKVKFGVLEIIFKSNFGKYVQNSGQIPF